jgi:hypothetical protein
MFIKSLFYCENSAFRHKLQYKNLVRRLPDETRGNCVGFRNGGHREQRNRPRVGHLYILNLCYNANFKLDQSVSPIRVSPPYF